MTEANKLLLGKRTDERGRVWDVGRDPQQVSRDELIAYGHKPMSPLKALRAMCGYCKAGELSEVTGCATITCPSRPFRMGVNPWRKVSSGKVAKEMVRCSKNLEFDFSI